MIATITVPVDEDTARIYSNAPPEDQKKLRLLLSLWLREFAVVWRQRHELTRLLTQ